MTQFNSEDIVTASYLTRRSGEPSLEDRGISTSVELTIQSVSITPVALGQPEPIEKGIWRQEHLAASSPI
jgi:hypothetical protein